MCGCVWVCVKWDLHAGGHDEKIACLLAVVGGVGVGRTDTDGGDNQ